MEKLIASLVGAGSGFLGTIGAALGFNSRIARLEKVTVSKDTCAAVHLGVTQQFEAVKEMLEKSEKAAAQRAERIEAKVDDLAILVKRNGSSK